MAALLPALYPGVFPNLDNAAAAALTPGLSAADVTAPFLANFPYLGTPYDGFGNPRRRPD